MKMELRYFRQARLVRVTRKANTPPKRMDTTAGAHGQIDGVQQGGPQVGLGQGAGEQVDVVHQGIAGGLAGEMGIDGAGVDLEGVLHNGHDGGDGGDGHHDAHQQQDHVVGLGQEGPEPVPEDGGPCWRRGSWFGSYAALLSCGNGGAPLERNSAPRAPCSAFRQNRRSAPRGPVTPGMGLSRRCTCPASRSSCPR